MAWGTFDTFNYLSLPCNKLRCVGAPDASFMPVFPCAKLFYKSSRYIDTNLAGTVASVRVCTNIIKCVVNVELAPQGLITVTR